MDETDALEVTIRGRMKDGGYRLKVSLFEQGMYIDGFRATPTARHSSGWWIQPPAIRVGQGWKPLPEFDKGHSFWQAIENACVKAVEHEEATAGREELTDEDFSDAAIAKNLDDAVKQLGLDDMPTERRDLG